MPRSTVSVIAISPASPTPMVITTESSDPVASVKAETRPSNCELAACSSSTLVAIESCASTSPNCRSNSADAGSSRNVVDAP